MTECENLSEPGVDEVTDATDDNTDLFIAASENALHDTKRVREDCDDDGLSPIDAKKSVLHNLKFDVAYRRKFILSLSVFWSYVTLGWVVLQIGTALPDLQTLVDIDLDSASWLFTTWSLGFLAGSLIGGFLYDRYNRLIIMCACTMGAAVCSACLPYSGTFSIMLVLRVLTGIFCGGIDTGANTIIPSIWGVDGGPYMQALYLSYTLGGIVVPFGTRPFMLPRSGLKHSVSMNKSTSSDAMYNYVHIHQLTDESNTSKTEFNSSFSKDDGGPFEHSEGQIHYALILTSVLLIISAIPYFVMNLLKGFDQRRVCYSSDENSDPEKTSLRENNIDKTAAKTSGKRKWFVLTCVFGVSLFYSATEDSLGDFLVTFCIDYLEWDNNSSVTLLSLYWIASCVGGLTGVILVRVLHTSKLLFLAHIAWVLIFLASLIASVYKIHIMVWIFLPMSGFFMVLIMPAVISWTEEHVCDVTGGVSSMIMISVGSGLAANPKFIGHMMESYSYLAFIYILFVESILCSCFYVVGYIGRFAFQQNTSK